MTIKAVLAQLAALNSTMTGFDGQPYENVR